MHSSSHEGIWLSFISTPISASLMFLALFALSGLRIRRTSSSQKCKEPRAFSRSLSTRPAVGMTVGTRTCCRFDPAPVVVDIPDCVFSNLAKPRTVFRHGSARPCPLVGTPQRLRTFARERTVYAPQLNPKQAYVIAWFIVRYNSAVAGDDVLVDAGTDG